MCETDALAGLNSDCILKLVAVMSGLGYLSQCFEKTSGLSGVACFYKKDKFDMIQACQKYFVPDSQFFMYCQFSLKTDKDFKFIVAATHFKAKPENMDMRTAQSKIVVEFFKNNFQD